MISDGWNCIGPAPSQRRAPLTLTPMPGSSTSTSNANATSSSTGVSRRIAASPWRDSTCIATSPIPPYIRYLTR